MRRAFSASICCRRFEPRAVPWAGMKDTFGVVSPSDGERVNKFHESNVTRPLTPLSMAWRDGERRCAGGERRRAPVGRTVKGTQFKSVFGQHQAWLPHGFSPVIIDVLPAPS